MEYKKSAEVVVAKTKREGPNPTSAKSEEPKHNEPLKGNVRREYKGRGTRLIT